MTFVRERVAVALVSVASLLPGPAGGQEPDADTLALGRAVFTEVAEPGCPICHTLSDAGAAGEVGPSLDALRPDAARVAKAVTEGIGPMQPYVGLDAAQVDALAAYVAAVAGR